MSSTHDHSHAETNPSTESHAILGADGLPGGISLTEKAAAKVREIREAEGLGEQGLRLRVIGGGCSGFTYDLYFEDETTDLDQVFESAGIKLFIDMMSYQYLENTEIDYVEGLHGAGFKFLNPTAKSTCGCGSSFSA
ncbi:MAG: iron-sulfur cluster insertion protein ErpA [Sandaracinaceae bacterium]|jgi:iron-sulfur cluster insertion protein|nr:iron-sulfur cluster insertion protein ErpA [Sandaracinaceae bacterium]